MSIRIATPRAGKPHIKRDFQGRLWLCYSTDGLGYGWTVKESYNAWDTDFWQRKYLRRLSENLVNFGIGEGAKEAVLSGEISRLRCLNAGIS